MKLLKSKKFVITFILALAAGAILFASILRQKRASATTYSESRIEKGDLSISVLATGTVQPENRLEIKPPIAGRIEKVLVNEGQKVTRGQTLVWMSSTERAALLDAARSGGISEVKKWEDLYRPTAVVAPISGTIILRNVEAGQSFSSTDAILVMSDRLTVKAQVDETDLAQIKLKQTATIILDAYAAQSIPAQVDEIAYEAKTVNNVTNYIVDVLPIEIPDFMRSGMSANVSFVVAAREGVLLVPNEALKIINGRNHVLLKNSEDEGVDREIEVGVSDGKKTEVTAGLNEGDVVLSPQMNLKGSTALSSPFMPSPRKRDSKR